jgi:L-lysine 6-transaminase
VDACLAQLEELMQRYPDEIAGVVLEPMQGAGGHRNRRPALLPGAFSVKVIATRSAGGLMRCRPRGQCGKVFAIDLFDIPYSPQAIACAKNLVMGSCSWQRSMQDVGVLDSTWGELWQTWCVLFRSGALVRDEQLVAAVADKSVHLVAGLQQLAAQWPKNCTTSGAGACTRLLAASARAEGRLLAKALEDEDLLLLGAGTESIRFRPPLDVLFAGNRSVTGQVGALVPAALRG